MLRFLPDATHLIVQDDGSGLGYGAEDMPGSHFGLQGIRERVDKLGGVLEISSAPGAGTRLAVTVPGRTREAAAGFPRVQESWRTG